MSGIQGLLRAELRRFFSRRVTRAMFAFGIALATVVLVILTVRSAESDSTQRSNSYVCASDTLPTATVSPPSNFGVPAPEDCFTQVVDTPVHHDRRVRIHDNYSETVKGTGFAAVFLAFVIGASFVGAEFGAGSLSTQLLFEPRRIRFVLVKALAVAIGLALLTAALLLYIGLLQWGASSLRGVVSGLDGSWFAARAGDVGRVSLAAACAGTAAYAVTIVARRTVAAVAGLLIIGWASAIVSNVRSWRWAASYNPANAFFALVADETRRAGNDVLLPVRSALAWSGVWAVGLTLIAAMIFARREVR